MIASNPSSRWELSIGDSSIIGWTITIAYLAASWLCLRAAMRASAMRDRGSGDVGPGEGILRLWLFAAVMLFALGINKELDLQKLLLEVARIYAQEGGWYRERRPLQYTALAAVVIACIAGSAWVVWTLRRHLGTVVPVTFGLLVLGTYVAVRMSSHHDLDQLMRAGPLPLRDSMELIGLIPVAWSAWRFPRPISPWPPPTVNGP